MNHKVGDVLFLTRKIGGVPYDTGYWVLCERGDATSFVALASSNQRLGLYAIDNWYQISTEDLAAFSKTGKTAHVPPPSAEGLEQEFGI